MVARIGLKDKGQILLVSTTFMPVRSYHLRNVVAVRGRSTAPSSLRYQRRA